MIAVKNHSIYKWNNKDLMLEIHRYIYEKNNKTHYDLGFQCFPKTEEGGEICALYKEIYEEQMIESYYKNHAENEFFQKRDSFYEM